MRDPFELALQHHQAGRLDNAEELYKEVLARQPNRADAIHNLGVIALQSGRNDLAVILLRRAILLSPMQASGYSNLGNALLGLAQPKEAVDAYRQALAIEPSHRDALGNLGVALMEVHQTDEAISIYRRLIAKYPSNVEAQYNLGLALIATNQFSEAVECCKRAIALRPNYAEAHHNLGLVLSKLGRVEDAISAFSHAVAANPRLVQAHCNLADALRKADRHADSVAAYHKAISIEPNLAEAHNGLGKAMYSLGNLDAAIAAYRQAVAIDPCSIEAICNLSGALKDAGRIDDAVAGLRRALELKPSSPGLLSDLILSLHYRYPQNGAQIARELAHWARLNDSARLSKVSFPNNRNPTRTLKIGYVSADFTFHPVGRFMLPILAQHDHAAFEIHCFSNASFADEATDWFKKSADHWHDISKRDDTALAELIVQDGIDILVDLSLHTAGNRLPIFAKKSAPVQVTHLAYCGSSGLEAMDYVLTDRYLWQPDLRLAFSEEPVRLPNCYWCYRPLPNAAEPGELPAIAEGYVTFGCLNNFCKISSVALDAWCGILQAVPRSRLLLHAREGSHREQLREGFSAAGVDSSRLDFIPFVPITEFMLQHLPIDICLDPFPFCGGTTTCDALWMGVPVVSLAGQTPVSRGGLSILSNVGLPELVANSIDEYIRIATELAADLPRLSQLRATLRQRMQNSPLMDERQYVLDLEAIYREMWRKWCQA